MNYYQMLNNPGGYKTPHRKKKKNQDWYLLSTVETRPQSKNINTTRMVNQIIRQTIFLVSTSSSKGKRTPNLKMKKQNNKMMVTRFPAHRCPYIKSMVTQMK